jgi:hypothetical protein
VVLKVPLLLDNRCCSISLSGIRCFIGIRYFNIRGVSISIKRGFCLSNDMFNNFFCDAESPAFAKRKDIWFKRAMQNR